MAKRALSLPQVAALRAVGNHWVAQSLYLQVRTQGSRSWLFRYERDGRTRWLGLGPAAGPAPVNLSHARDEALRLYIAVRDGADPVTERRAKRAEVVQARSDAPTFAWCADQYIAAHEAGWRNSKHRGQWASTLETHAGPVLGNLPVDQIAVDHVLKVLKPIWLTMPETASRLRGRIERVMGWAAAKGYRTGENAARWQGGALSHLLPPLGRIQKRMPHRAVPYSEVPALAARLRGLDTINAKALLLTILAAARTSETVGARWTEIDLDARSWTVPASRMKANKEHRVALSDAAIDLLRGLPRQGVYVFPGQRPRKPIANAAMLMVLRGLRPDQGETTHGFRASFSTWAAEATDHPREIVEACLAHATGNAVELAYKRTDYIEKRRAVMADWGEFVMGQP